MESEILKGIANSGPSGIIAALVLAIYWRETRRHEAEITRLTELYESRLSLLVGEYRSIVQENTKAITHLVTLVREFMRSVEEKEEA